MRQAKDTLYRQWSMLRCIPRSPREVGTRELREALRSEGFAVDVRTIQRDLEKLSGIFPLISEANGRAKRWAWMREGASLEIPGMDPSTALAFRLAQEYLPPLLPQSSLRHLQPYFERAKSVLGAGGGNRLGLWPDKVCRVVRGPGLMPPEIRPEVHEVVTQALLDDRQIEVRYQRRDAERPKSYPVNPLGLVFVDGVVYLVCTAREYDEIIKLALHRMSAARLLDVPCRRPEKFALHTHVQEDQEFAYPVSPHLIRLRALFDDQVAPLFKERRLAKDQKVTMQKDGRVLLDATVKDSLELRWWLQGFGDKVEVLGPKPLREEFKRVASQMANMYR